MKLSNLLFAATLALVGLSAASCVKTVPVSGLSVSQTSLTLTEGEEAHLTVTVVPDNATDKSVVWKSSDAAVATVNDGLVRAVAPGTATITVATPDGQQTASCFVTVNRQAVPVTSVSLDQTSLEMLVGDEVTLTATVSPADADIKTVSWSSDNEAVATVADGKVKAVGAGDATITVTTTDGGKTATCAVTVTEPQPQGVSFVKMEAEALAGLIEARADHALFMTAGGEIVAAGGHVNGFSITNSAEYFKDGEWHALPNMTAKHDMPFSVALSDGRFLIGGGCSSGSGIGQSAYVDVYDPSAGTFSAFASLTSARTLSHAALVGDKVLVTGNWYSGDSMETWADGAETFSYAKDVSQERYNPYIFPTSASNAIIFGAYSNHGGLHSEFIVDRLDGDPFTPALFETWKPMGIGSNWRPQDCAIGDGKYLFMVNKKDATANRGGAVALVDGENISLLPVDSEVPEDSEFGAVYFAGPIVVDKTKNTAYAFGSNGEGSNVVCYILKIEYADALAGGKAKLTMYYTDAIASFPGTGGQSGIVLMPDGRVMVAGGIYNSNYSPFSTVYAFKPF
jgi:hypothetical protein